MGICQIWLFQLSSQYVTFTYLWKALFAMNATVQVPALYDQLQLLKSYKLMYFELFICLGRSNEFKLL